MAGTNVPSGRSPGKSALPRRTIQDRRHAELVESLWRISVGVEALYQQGERLLKAQTAAEARHDAQLRYLIQCWQEVRGSATP